MTGRYDDSDDRVRGFPAFPPQPGRHRGGRFGRSWWGNAWVEAMQDTALDQEQLKRGRRYASAGHVGTITVSPGRIAAPVHEDQETAYSSAVHVEQLTGAEWERFLDRVAANAGHIAALLEADMPHDLVDAAAGADVALLPGLGDLEPECGCPGWEHPCKHAAALCYQAARLLDSDPFVLLLMRGRGQRELLEELQRRNARQGDRGDEQGPAAAAVGAAGPSPGTPARQAYARDVPPLPDPPPLVDAPPMSIAPFLAVAEAPGIDPDVLERLVADAAARARELLAADEVLELAPPAAGTHPETDEEDSG